VKRLVCSGVGRWDWVKARDMKLGWVFAFQEDFYSVLEDRSLCPALEQCVLEGQVQNSLERLTARVRTRLNVEY
jgi:hypothetical protein